jgi:hypothetical protein
MSLLALSLSVLAVAASLAVALQAWHAMTRLDDDLSTYASFELMRLDIAPVAHARPAPSRRFNEPSDRSQGPT